MPIAVNPKKQWKYVLACDREAVKAGAIEKHRVTVFTLRALRVEDNERIKNASLSALDMKDIKNNEKAIKAMNAASVDDMDSETLGALASMVNIGDFLGATVDSNIERVRLGIAGWENFYDEDGNAIPCIHEKDGKRLSSESIQYLDGHFAELSEAIQKRNTVNVDDLGK